MSQHVPATGRLPSSCGICGAGPAVGWNAADATVISNSSLGRSPGGGARVCGVITERFQRPLRPEIGACLTNSAGIADLTAKWEVEVMANRDPEPKFIRASRAY